MKDRIFQGGVGIGEERGLLHSLTQGRNVVDYVVKYVQYLRVHTWNKI